MADIKKHLLNANQIAVNEHFEDASAKKVILVDEFGNPTSSGGGGVSSQTYNIITSTRIAQNSLSIPVVIGVGKMKKLKVYDTTGLEYSIVLNTSSETYQVSAGDDSVIDWTTPSPLNTVGQTLTVNCSNFVSGDGFLTITVIG